jgi:ABC-type transport system involved in multi-copper enzyme maturation permease subunit
MFTKALRLVGKDLFVLKHERIFVLLFTVAILFVAVAAGNSPWTMMFFGLFPIIIYISYTFSQDYRGAERLYASLPVRRSEIVVARYAGTFSIAVAILSVSYLLNLIGVRALPNVVHPLPVEFAAYFVALYALVCAASLPVYFRVGVVKARAVMLLLYMLPGVVGGALIGLKSGDVPAALGGLTRFPPVVSPWIVFLIPLLALAALAGSAPLSVRFFRRRDI